MANLTVAEAAKKLGVSTGRIRQMLSKGMIEGARKTNGPGRIKWLIPEESLPDKSDPQPHQGSDFAADLAAKLNLAEAEKAELQARLSRYETALDALENMTFWQRLTNAQKLVVKAIRG